MKRNAYNNKKNETREWSSVPSGKRDAQRAAAGWKEVIDMIRNNNDYLNKLKEKKVVKELWIYIDEEHINTINDDENSDKILEMLKKLHIGKIIKVEKKEVIL